MKQTREMREKLFNWIATAKTYPPMNQEIHLTEKEKERLEALGYLATQKNEGYEGDGVLE